MNTMHTNTLHTFGCSLMASKPYYLVDTHWTEKLAKRINYNIQNYAVPAGDNVTQIRRFKNLVLHNNIKKNDYILWEVTYLNRLGFRLSPDHHFYVRNKDNKEVKHNFHKDIPNILDNQSHIDYVSFNKEWYNINWYVQNINEMLADLLFSFKISNILTGGNTLVWFAENNIFETKEIESKFIKYLDDNDIKHLDYKTESLMSWVKQNNHKLASDKMHPSESVYDLYCKTFIEPIIINDEN